MLGTKLLSKCVLNGRVIFKSQGNLWRLGLQQTIIFPFWSNSLEESYEMILTFPFNQLPNRHGVMHIRNGLKGRLVVPPKLYWAVRKLS